MNNRIQGGFQGVNANIQQETAHITGFPLRVYPFKIVSGLSYMTNRGQKDLGTDFGAVTINPDNTSFSNYTGGFSGTTIINAGNKPIIAYWFGVVNTVINNDGVTTTINAIPLQEFADNQETLWTPQSFKNPFNNNLPDFPWKEVGLLDYSYTYNTGENNTLDNVSVQTYDMNYLIKVISNDWVPTLQEVTEFIYYILDARAYCPIALRISNVSPRYNTDGVLQDCSITFESVNQFFNNNGRTVLNYVKFGAVGDGYAFPKEVNIGGAVQTIIDMELLNPENGGVDEICIKNNSLAGQFGALVYGTPYVSYTVNANNQLSKTYDRERYLLPLTFTSPINDNFVSKDNYIQSSYDIMCGMIVINEQMWGNWKQTKEVYNTTQNFTFQGGLAFAVSTNTALSGGYDSILSAAQQAIFSQDNTLSYNFGNISKVGSGNLGNVLMSNLRNLKLDELSNSNVVWYPPNSYVGINGFWLNNRNIIMDFRGLGLVNVYTTNNTGWIEYYVGGGYSPTTAYSNEVSALTNVNTGINANNMISPQKFFVLNSMSMLNVHQLEINYRDGIVYTNTNQGHGGIWPMIKNFFCGVIDKIIGYTPGYSNFFLNTYARNYNLLIPSSLAPLFNQYLDPSGDNYDAVPLDIFANTNENNTSVGQLKYISGYQFKLTDYYYSTTGNMYDTTGWRNTTTDNLILVPNTNYKAPDNSFIFFSEPLESPQPMSYVINSINVKQLGQSNLHITYYKNVNNELESVGMDWIVNTAKLMNNTSYIDNQIDYYCYDKYNISVADNTEPYLNFQEPAVPTYSTSKNAPTTIPSSYLTPGKHYLSPLKSSPVVGISVNYNYQPQELDTSFTVEIPQDFVSNYFYYNFPGGPDNETYYNNYKYNSQDADINIPSSIANQFNLGGNNAPQFSDGFTGLINPYIVLGDFTNTYNVKNFNNTYDNNYNSWYYNACNKSSTTITNKRIPLNVEVDYKYGWCISWTAWTGGEWSNPTIPTTYGSYGSVLNYGVTNINYLITNISNNLLFQLPNKYNSNYVLIPHGANVEDYLNNWTYNEELKGVDGFLLLDNNNSYVFTLGNFQTSLIGYNGVPILGGMTSWRLPNVNWPDNSTISNFNCINGNIPDGYQPQPFIITFNQNASIDSLGYYDWNVTEPLSTSTDLLSSTDYDMYLFYEV